MNLNLLRLSARSFQILTTLFCSLLIFQNASTQNCSANLAANPGFESGISGWNVIGGNATTSTDANSGNFALELGGATGYNAVNQAFVGKPNTFYSLRAFLKQNNSDSSTPLATIKFYNASWQPLNSPSERFYSDTYEELYFVRKSPPTTTYVGVEFSYNTSQNSQKVLIDDVCFLEEPNNANCSISAQVVNLVCDDNGTPVNQLDDTYVAELSVTGNNLSSGFRLVKTNYFYDYGNYNSPYFTEVLDIRDGVQDFVLTDFGNENCEYTISITPPPTCSNQSSGCTIDLTLTQPICNDNGTPNNPLDDTYTFTATATGDNVGTGWTSFSSGLFELGGSVSGTYGVPTTVGPLKVYNSTLFYLGITDNNSNSPCSASESINGPLACSSGDPNVCPGSLLQNGNFSNSINGWELFGNTGIVSNGAVGNGLEICTNLANGISSSNISQDFSIPSGTGRKALITWNYIRVSGDGLPIVRMTFYDSNNDFIRNVLINPGYQNGWNTFSQERGIPDNAANVTVVYGVTGGQDYGDICAIFDELCFEIIGATTPTCNIAATATPSTCTNNGTPNNPNDDRYNITIEATSTGGSAAGYDISYVNDVQNKNFNGIYGTNTFIGQNAISEGTVTLTLTDKSNSNCKKVLTVTPPAPCSGGTGGNGGDLKLTATGAPANIAAWQFGNSTFTLTNEGTQSVSGIQVSFDLHASAKLKGGDEYDASQGTLESFWTQVPIWNVGSLAPGQTESIQLNIFTLSGDEMPVYGQVFAASGNDPDSAPNNGNAPTPNEDDEAVFVFNGSSNPTPQVDLRLSNLAISNTPTAGDILNYNFNVINDGNAAVSGNYNIKAYISTDNVLSNDDIQDGIVPTGNTPVGTIPSVLGASTLPANLPQGDYYLILKIDADNQISESNEANNTVSAPFTIGGSTNLPDLVVQNVIPRQQQVFIGQGVSVLFDGVNFGEPVPFSSFPIIYALYMSSDRNLSANDVKILDLGLGRGAGLTFGGQVPPNLAPGNYYLIVETDFPNNITESNEGNNWAASNQTVEAVPVGNTCSFVKSHQTPGFDAPTTRSNYSLTENALGYRLETNIQTNFNPSTFISRVHEVGLNGGLISVIEPPVPPGLPPFVDLEVTADKKLVMIFQDGSDLPVGTRVLVDVGNSDPTEIYAPSAAYRTMDGGYAFGLAVIDTDQSPLLKNIVIKTDNLGQNVQLFDLPNPDFYYGFLPSIEGSDGGLFFRLTTAGNFSLYGVPASGSTAWNYRVASDTPSSSWFYTRIGTDGNYIYTQKTDNQQTVIAKIDVATGTPTLLDLSDLKAPSPGGSFRPNYASGISPTSDGGLLMSMNFSEVTGVPRLRGSIIAKFDADGNRLWSHEFNTPAYSIDVTPVGETSDGGAFFIGRNTRGTNDATDDETFFIKTAANGALAPICDTGSDPGTDLELSFSPLADPSPSQWGFFSTTLTLTNNGTEAASGISVQFEKADEVTYKGGDEFNASQGDFQYWGNEIWTVGNLAAGESATLTVNYFRLSANPFVAFAEVETLAESDIDSAPGNGNCCTAREDDEAAIAVGSSSARSVNGRTLLEGNIGEREGFAIINASPNPFSNQLTLNVFSNESQVSEVLIFDVLGRPVLRQAVDLVDGHNSISIDASDLPTGFLTVKMSPEHKYLRQVRVLKMRD